METSNTPTAQQLRPISAGIRIFCCIVLFVCSAALPLLPYYIDTDGFDPALPLAITLGILALCAIFVLTLCKKPLFLGCSVACALFLALFSPYFSALFAALLCGVVATAAMTADDKHNTVYLFAGIASLAAYGVSLAVTQDAMLALCALLPILAGFAMSYCYRNGYAIIPTVGVTTGMLLFGYVTLIVGDALLAGMQPSVQGVTAFIKAYHTSVSALFAESLQLLAETPEISTQLASVLGGEITPESIAAFSDSVAAAMLGMLPGVAIMIAWIFAFIAHRGFTALLVRGLDKKDYPTELTTYIPSVPTAIFMILCYAALVLFSLFSKSDVLVFIALNLLLSILPMMTVCGLLSIISNVKRAPVKWPLLLTYLLAVFFLGIAVIPMIAFFGSFAVITNAIASALEKKFHDFKGGQ